MKKLGIILLALTLALVMLVPMVMPVAAGEPDNKPVAWVNFGGSNGNSKDEMGSHQHLSILVKQLSDGSTVGHIHSVNFTTGEEWNFNIIDSRFEEEDGVKVADILTSLVVENNITLYFWWQLKDFGEPGNGRDTFKIWWWLPVLVPYVWPLPPIGPYPPTPPPYPPGWYDWGPVNTITAGNIQVHLKGE
jgi:hypothetical protein